jgi:hypothetical protein
MTRQTAGYEADSAFGQSPAGVDDMMSQHNEIYDDSM